MTTIATVSVTDPGIKGFCGSADLGPVTLIVGPKLVAQEVWTREAAKWAHLAHLEIYHITAADFGYYKRVTTAAVWGDQSREIVRGLETPDDRIFLFGAEFTWVYAHRYGSRRPAAGPAVSSGSAA